jgi:cytochrome c-type biogenesis protein CcmH/NrfG
MPAKPARNALHAWLTYQLRSAREQALHRQGMDTANIPSSHDIMQRLTARVEHHVEALVRDCREAR